MNEDIQMMIQQKRIENMVTMYTFGVMLKNYASGVLKRDTPKEEQYMANKIKQLIKSIDLVIGSTDRFLTLTGGINDVEDYVTVYHNATDELFGLTEQEIIRVTSLMKKIKKERNPLK